MLTNPKYSVKQQTLKNSGVCAARHHTPLRRVDTGAINPNSPGDLTGIVERPVTVTGTVSKPVATVTINQQLATLNGLGFTFNNFFLHEGVNLLTVVATEATGRTATSTITV